MGRDKLQQMASSSARQSISSGITSVKEKVKKGKTTILTGSASGAVLVFKEILTRLIFKCPEDNYQAYATLFIGGPAVILFCVSILLSRSFGDLMTGSCRLSVHNRRNFQKTRRSICIVLVPPLTWIMLVFFRTDFYVCSQLGSKEAQLRAVEETRHHLNSGIDPVVLNQTIDYERSVILKRFDAAYGESQMIAMYLVVLAVFLATVFITVQRCCSKIDYKEEYDDVRADEAVALFRQKIEPMAKEDAHTYLEDLFEKHKDVENVAEKVQLIVQDLQTEFPGKDVHKSEE